MGRTSLAPQRTAAILDAVDRVIVRDGVGGTTMAAIAREARMPTSLVHHYLGSRQQALDSAIDRALERVDALMVDALSTAPGADQLSAHLDVLFSPALEDPLIEQLLEHLIVASYSDARIRDRLATVYRRFVDIVEGSLATARPELPSHQRTATARAVVALAHASPTLSWLRLHPELHADLRTAANALIDAAN